MNPCTVTGDSLCVLFVFVGGEEAVSEALGQQHRVLSRGRVQI